MICPHWASSATTARSDRPARGARRCRCRAGQRPFNERTGTPFPHWPYPTALVCLIVLGRFRYQLSLRDWVEMLLQRGLILTQEAVRKWDSTWAPLRRETLRKRRYGMVGTSWSVEASYVTVPRRWCELHRAIDRDGQLIAVRLRDTPELAAAEACFGAAWRVTGVTPARITTDGHDAYPRAMRHVFGKHVTHRTKRSCNHEVAQAYRGIHPRDRPMCGCQTCSAAARFGRVFDESRAVLRPQAHRHAPLTLRRAGASRGTGVSR